MSEGNYHGPDRRRADVRIGILEERVSNLIRENTVAHEDLNHDLVRQREQTHEWMDKMINRLPVWAVSVLTLGSTALGAMAMWILTHK